MKKKKKKIFLQYFIYEVSLSLIHSKLFDWLLWLP